MMNCLVLVLVLSLTVTAKAKVEVLFHPHDPTLEKIAEWITQARSTIDIAMYNMETSASSPVIKALQSSLVQKRIGSRELKIRLIFEGYAAPEEKAKKMTELEALGLDVRFLGKPVKVHHKFAVLDAGTPTARVITGSANWSLSSYRNYNENILFFTNEDEVTGRFNFEFSRLWKASREFGNSSDSSERPLADYDEEQDVAVFFNSPRTVDKGSHEDAVLTEQVVRLIQSAEHTLQIATTRVRLVEVLEALKAAAERGVHIQLVISQDDFMDIGKRAGYLSGHENLELRVKFYNLKVSDYMMYQMHNKFMIVDGATVLAGSFNWSKSSENSHIENLVELSGAKAAQVMQAYTEEFESIFSMGRDAFAPLAKELAQLKSQGASARCAIKPMALSVSEVRRLVKLGQGCK
ncbi:MAG: phospholipase D-like domain-containing protein [Bdellovibrio sp.]